MTGPLPADAIGYRNGDNTALRWALFQVWKQCCYSCKEPQIFGNTEIDHIIPRATDPDELQRLIDAHGLDVDFHIDRPANLAPICRRCNSMKSNRNLLHALVTTAVLARAKDRAPEVERRYRAYHSANDVAKGLITAAKADPYDPEIRNDILEYAPAIVRTLALVDEDKASDFVSLRHLQVDGQDVLMGVDKRGRFALSVIKDICGDSVETVVAPILSELRPRLEDHAGDHLRTEWGAGILTLLKANVLHMHVTEFRREGTTMVVSFLGGLVCEFDVDITYVHEHGAASKFEPPEGLQVEVTFETSARWDLSAVTGALSVAIDSAEFEVFELPPW